VKLEWFRWRLPLEGEHVRIQRLTGCAVGQADEAAADGGGEKAVKGKKALKAASPAIEAVEAVEVRTPREDSCPPAPRWLKLWIQHRVTVWVCLIGGYWCIPLCVKRGYLLLHACHRLGPANRPEPNPCEVPAAPGSCHRPPCVTVTALNRPR
jgi:hypothetical protein